jgi:4a-hydroxytetrahydrobiopterin dehydratase
VERRKLDPDEVTAALAETAGWGVNEKGELYRKFKFDNFAAALEFVGRVGAIAERHDHHPDITFGWGYADISLITHDRGGLTDFDFAMAKEIDEL